MPPTWERPADFHQVSKDLKMKEGQELSESPGLTQIGSISYFSVYPFTLSMMIEKSLEKIDIEIEHEVVKYGEDKEGEK